ncbi:MAG: N-6 DNA methylase [Candidatus Lokiarchaeota archaeon]|nr:N-6 DNA methylase [Candidatus Lokiarchaeota archaeon]
MNLKKELGVILTPQKTADYIVSKLINMKKIEKICDPCVGPGVFVKSLLKAGVDNEKIFTFDLDNRHESDILQLGVSFQSQDTLLSFHEDLKNEFDIIVGNPPYLNKSSSYIRENKKLLKKIYGKINAHETYSMFLVNGIWRLKEGGRLGFITSDSFLTLKTHAKLRRFILDNCKINEILLAPKGLFSSQNVSTSPAIIILTKCSGKENILNRKENIMQVVPRVENENQYDDPSVIHTYKQEMYELLPFNLFFSDMELEIIKLFQSAPKLKHYLKGYIGMHTHDNRKYIAAIEGTPLAELFQKRNETISEKNQRYKILPRSALDSEQWKPYLKRGGADQYYRPIWEALDWDSESQKIYDIPKSVPFEEEGIVISGVSSKLAARHMPKGCYWDSNKAIGFVLINPSLSIEYFLGLLNSSLYNYLAKGILNNTSSIQITTIHALPFVHPDIDTQSEVEKLVKQIISEKKKNFQYDLSVKQEQIDNLIYDFHAQKFNFKEDLGHKLKAFGKN